MPLYALIYISIFLLFAFGSTYMHFEEGRNPFLVILEILSSILLISYIYLFFHDNMAVNKLLIMLAICYNIAFEYFNSKKDIKLARQQFGINDKELKFYTAIGLAFAAPAYMAGFAVLFR